MSVIINGITPEKHYIEHELMLYKYKLLHLLKFIPKQNTFIAEQEEN